MKNIFLFTIFLLILGGCSKNEKITLKNPIKLVWSGSTYQELKTSEFPQRNETNKVKTLYNFNNVKSSKENLSVWVTTIDDGLTMHDLDYHYYDQGGEPQLIRYTSVGDDFIKYYSRFMNKIDEKNNVNTYLTHEVRINRITGEWVDDWYNDRKYRDGTWSKERIFKSGKCESGQPKF